MKSTTTRKKEIVDFLWDWTNDSNWAKLLVHKVVQSENELGEDELEEVFNYFLESIGLEDDLQELDISKPEYSPESNQIELKTLSEVTGVNKLAEDQVIDFSENITVIYGENGTGKTGYGRILKAFGFSYDQQTQIYTNIFEEDDIKQSAKMRYLINGEEEEFNWDGDNHNEDLENISVFDNNCVEISLDDERQLIVSPIGFHLFNIVSKELNKLSQLLNEEKDKHSTDIEWIEQLNEDTPQNEYIKELSKDSTEKALKELSAFTPEHQDILEKKKEKLSNLNKALLSNRVKSLKQQITELKTVLSKTKNIDKIINSENWERLIKFNNEINELQKHSQKGIAELTETNGIELYETEEFKNFLEPAESYIKRLNGKYPDDEDVCVYCQQPLKNESKELLENYRELLNDDTEEKLKKVKTLKKDLIKKIENAKTNLKLMYPNFGSNKDEKPIQPVEFKEFNKTTTTLKNAMVSDTLKGDFTFSIKVRLEKLVSDKKEELEEQLKSKSEALDNIEETEKELKKEIAELKDCRLLSKKSEDVKKAIENYKVLSIINKNAKSFNTSSVSRKTTQAREELISQDFNDNFFKELKAFRKENLPIELDFGTHKGNTKITHQISKHQLLKILSEGEQKAIALAEFLTELQLDSTVAPVVFDDPVNSLDHKIIDSVGKRLIHFSKERQVIIFTHSILLLNSLIQQSELPINRQEGIDFKFVKLKSNFGVTGLVNDVEEINSYSYYKKKLNLLLNDNKLEGDEEKIAAEGYGHLRSAIEVFVEKRIFQQTIKRYGKGVAFPSLLRIKGSVLDEEKRALNDIYEKCCTSIDGHSSPEQVPTTPSIDELKTDYENFKYIRKKFV